MENFLQQVSQQDAARRLPEILDRVTADHDAHAKLLNTLSRLEYVGVRKMLKSRRAESFDLDGLQHLVEEAAHALRLKRLAHRIAEHPHTVATFAEAHTLTGDEAEDYFQKVDQAAASVLEDLPEPERGAANYFLTSAAIEIRADVFYPIYEQKLRQIGAPVSVAVIQRDEERHLQAMSEQIAQHLSDWQIRLSQVLKQEELAFQHWLDLVEEHLQKPDPLASS
ncbi:MAG: hypothetical protein DWQ01_17365 [Planctomycetota bacterium]|nr:MAG: hypothetical protein DWQ01_17365 [Planctomycetota bacterium]